MGLRSAAYICQRVTNSVSFMLNSHYGVQVINYLDDFAGCDIPARASASYDALGHVLKQCGLEESVDKASPPSTSMVFLGVLFDTVTCTLSITQDRLEEILSLVESWIQKGRCF